jgi:DNA repair photolyase
VASIREIEAKSILRKSRKIDSWFLCRYGMNLYRGCAHDCTYCDGRAEKYAVTGTFGEEVEVKVNAVELLAKELDPTRRRVKLARSYLMLGGGVGDSYQPAEAEYRLTRRVLELLAGLGWPVHVLTKSTLVERDLSLLASIHRASGAVVSMSFSSVDNTLGAQFEPGVPVPSERLRVLARFKRAGIPVGIFLMPVIPLVTDSEPVLEQAVCGARELGADFICFGGLTLKEGRQKEHYLAALAHTHPELVEPTRRLYAAADPWGQARGDYYDAIQKRFARLAFKYRIPPRMPPALFRDLLGRRDLAVVILEHLDYLYRLRGRRTPFGRVAWALSQLKEQGELGATPTLSGFHPETRRIIEEVYRTGRCALHEGLLVGEP